MKALVLLVGGLALAIVIGGGVLMTTLVAVATHPWLAVGYLPGEYAAGSTGVAVAGGSSSSAPPAPAVGGVPVGQWPLIVATSQQSACRVTPEDLAAIAKIESDFGRNPAMRVPHTGGIVGYGQFDPATWRAYGNGGDIYSPAGGLAAIDRVLCARGYADNRTRALNSFGGCTTPTCLGETDYATQITALGQGFRADWGVVAIARSWLTKPPIPYVFGGGTRAGVDCSGLTVAVYEAVGVHLNRTALAQYQQKGVVTLLGQEQAQPGDLLFFSNTYMPGVSHVGIYTGDGMMVNAVNEQVGVALVPAFTGYWGSKFTAVGRVTPP